MNPKQVALVLIVALAVTITLAPVVAGQANNTDNETEPGAGQNESTPSSPTPSETDTSAPNTIEPTATPSPEPTATPSPEPTATPSPEPTATSTPTATESPPSGDQNSNTPTQTPTESAGNDAITDDGEIVECTTIEDDGMYTLESDLQGNPDDACLIFNASARIEGNGHTLEGPGDGETVGIRVVDGSVRVFDITLSGWDGVAIEHVRGEFRFEDSTVRDNGDGYSREWRAVTEMQNVEFTNNDGTAISTRYSKDFRAHDIVVSNNGGSGLLLSGGGRAVVTSSEFNNNGGTGILVGDRVLAEVSNVEINGNDNSGLTLSSSIHTAQVVMDDSSITNNGGDGINGIAGITDEFKRQVTLENVNIQGNDGKTIAAYDPYDTEGEYGSLVEATDVTLDGGLTVDFDQQFVTLGTVPVGGATTDAINITGNDSTAITTGFQIDADTGELWLRSSGGWESHGEYETSNGAFQETLGEGAWIATTVTQASGSSPPSGTPEPQSINTPDATPEPRNDNPSSPAPGESSPGMPDSEDPTTPPAGEDTSTTGTSAPASTASDGTDGPGTGDSDDSTTEGSEDSSSGDGPGFTGLAAIVALLGTITFVRRRR